MKWYFEGRKNAFSSSVSTARADGIDFFPPCLPTCYSKRKEGLKKWEMVAKWPRSWGLAAKCRHICVFPVWHSGGGGNWPGKFPGQRIAFCEVSLKSSQFGVWLHFKNGCVRLKNMNFQIHEKALFYLMKQKKILTVILVPRYSK